MFGRKPKKGSSAARSGAFGRNGLVNMIKTWRVSGGNARQRRRGRRMHGIKGGGGGMPF